MHDALADAETNSDAEIGSVFVATTGSHIRSFNSRGAIVIASDRYEIDDGDVQEVAVKAREVNIPTGKSLSALDHPALITLTASRESSIRSEW